MTVRACAVAGPRSDVTLVEGSTFCISEMNGDVVPRNAHGLFVRDVRALSRWEMRVNGQPLRALTVEQHEPFAARIAAHQDLVGDGPDGTLLVLRERYVGDGMREDVTVRNLSARVAVIVLSLRFESDFADLFEVKGGMADGRIHVTPEISNGVPSCARLHGASGDRRFVTELRPDGSTALHDTEVSWAARIAPHGEWRTSVEVRSGRDGTLLPLHHRRGVEPGDAVPARRLHEWRARSPRLETADPRLARTLTHSVADLGALRIFDPACPERVAIAAGAPWFMALFGRDALLTSWMLLPLDTGLAVGTLQALAERQGTGVDPASDEEPGRILHEVRFGSPELALGGRPVYYGSADATPLFVALAGELTRWGRLDAVEPLLEPVDRALTWITEYGDRDGDGFVEYAAASPRGLRNQGWKDSPDSVTFRDGTIAEPPIALAEVQGYCYAAYRARAEIATLLGDGAGATRWNAAADLLRQRFDEAFWLPELGWYAAALDAAKRPVDALTSSAGHCLWTGIVPDARAAAVAGRLVQPDMFSGWGVRTLSAAMAAYDPVSYHNGSVWPHDTAICVAGLVRYGQLDAAVRIADALLDAADAFGGRLPELFCGFDHSDFRVPVPYPAACVPQAWAAAAPLLLLRSLLRLDPESGGRVVRFGPCVPGKALPLHLDGLRVGDRVLGVDVTRRTAALRGAGDAATDQGGPDPITVLPPRAPQAVR